jgi:eukaryotic-like serine/threonine-protein kinase
MTIDSVPELVRVLRTGSLLTNGQLDVFVRDLLPRFTDVRALARELVRGEWLTPYQVNQLFLGRADDLVMGPYLLLERLGEGGMGEVFKARHRKMNRVVALKVIRREKLGNLEATRRFFREVQAAAALDHPNIVSAYDADEIGGVYFFAMEHVEGKDLGRLVKEKGPLKIGRVCEYMRQVALGLQHAFERGMVHRDIKPSNIIVRGSGTGHDGGPVVKILDMGVARIDGFGDDGEGPLTQVDSVLGTPDFIAPEQASNSRAADIRSDLYSLGCTFHYVLTGQVPFPAAGPMEKLLKHHLEAPPCVRTLRPEVPGGIARLVRRLMAKSPEGRPQTPLEVSDLLASMLVSQSRKPAVVPLAIPVIPAVPERPTDPEPSEDIPAEETLPEVTLEFETTDSIVPRIRATRARPRMTPRRMLTYAFAGIAIGLLTTLFFVLLNYALK